MNILFSRHFPRDLNWVVGLYCFDHPSLFCDSQLLKYVERNGLRQGDDKGNTILFGMMHSFNDQPALIQDACGIKFWYQYGKRHRENDSPAIIWRKENKYWYWKGQRHRENDLPAVIESDGSRWYWKGQLHRENGLPAVIQYNGNKEWWVHGQQIKK